MNRWRNNNCFIRGCYRRIINRIYHKCYNIIVLFIRFDFYFRKKRCITKAFRNKYFTGIKIDRFMYFCECGFNYVYQRSAVTIDCASFSNPECIERNRADSSIGTFALYTFFSGDDGRGKRLFVARYEASEDVTTSILFFVFCSRATRFIAMLLVRKNPDMSPITEIPIAISRSSEPFCLLCFLLQWLLMLFLPQPEHNDAIISFIFEIISLSNRCNSAAGGSQCPNFS